MTATSAGDLTPRSRRSSGVASAKASGATASRSRKKSVSGMRSTISGPNSAPIRPQRRGTSPSACASRLTPSSSGRGAGQVRISSTQVRAMPGAPISGITATGAPARGRTTNQGRVGLAQNCESKPVK